LTCVLRVFGPKRMYDTVEIPLKPGTPFTDRVASIKSAVEHNRNPLESVIPFRSNLYYSQVVDLRKVEDIDAVLHLNARKTGTHKIQIIEAGKKHSGEIADTIAQIVTEHPELQAVSRVDSCADVIDGPHVRWIAQSVRSRSAQWQAQFGTVEIRDDQGKKMPWSEMGKREVGTMYLGMRPNCFRVYDKLAERRQAWHREKVRHERLAAQVVTDKVIDGVDCSYWAMRFPTLKKWRRELEKQLIPSGREYFPFPSFEEWFAEQCRGPMTNLVQMRLPGQEEPEQMKLIPELPKVLTRIERQMGAGRIPERLNSFEKLFSRQALDFNPFDRLDFSAFNAITQIDASDYSVVEFAAGLQFKQWLEQGMSYQQLYAYWNSKRNAKAIAKKFAPFVAAANPRKEVTITAADLYERYRDSLTRQMAA
jgi:hypothetical protein